MFVNSLAMSNFTEEYKSYNAFLKEVGDTCMNFFENQDVQFEDLVDKLNLVRSPARNPVFTVALVHPE